MPTLQGNYGPNICIQLWRNLNQIIVVNSMNVTEVYNKQTNKQVERPNNQSYCFAGHLRILHIFLKPGPVAQLVGSPTADPGKAV